MDVIGWFAGTVNCGIQVKNNKKTMIEFLINKYFT
jgi:hypothetical protein